MKAMHRARVVAAAVVWAVLSLPAWAWAEIRLASIFGPEMILQRDLPVPIWGTGGPGEKVTVRFAGQVKAATADQAGRWRVRLDALQADDKPRTLTVRGAGKGAEIEGVRVGEVWLVLADRHQRIYQMEGSPPYPANRIWIGRQGREGAAFSNTPRESYGNNRPWGPSRWSRFTALTCSFSNRLHERLKVPVGIVMVRVGNLDATTPVEGFAAVGPLRDVADRVETWYPQTPRGAAAYEQWRQRIRQWAATLRGQLDSGGAVAASQPPLLPGPTPKDPSQPTVVYNEVLHPIVPFTFRGVLHAHAEANADDARYADKMHALIAGLRAVFRRPNMPVAFAQQCQPSIYSLHTIGAEIDLDRWAGHRDRQRRAQGLPNTGMIVTADIENYAADVGARFARWVLTGVYGKDQAPPCGATYKRHRVEGRRVEIEFSGVGKGLMSAEIPEIGRGPVERKDGRLRFFAVAGRDRIFHRAEARIDGEKVVVRCKRVDKPLAVRYAFHIDPRGMDLYNRAALPASPFRTDDWPVEDFEKLTEQLRAKSAEELVALFGYPAEPASHAAAKALAAKGRGQALPVVRRLLSGKDPDRRCGALRALGYLYWAGPVHPRRYYGVPTQPITPKIAAAIALAASAADDADPWVRHCVVEALALIGSENERVFQAVRKLATDADPRVRTAAARLSKYRLKKHAHATAIAYALLKARPLGDRTSAALAGNLLNHYRIEGPIDIAFVGQFFLRIGPGQGGPAVGYLGDTLRRIKTSGDVPSLNDPRAMPGVLHLYALGCRDYMLYGVERWIASADNIPVFRKKIDDLKTEIERLRRDRPDRWQDRSRRYQDAIEGLQELLKKCRKR